MMTPAATEDDLIAFVAETVRLAGGNPCPPVVLGVGIGGDFEQVCAARQNGAVPPSVSERNKDPFYAELEEKMLRAVNETGVGPQGFGGDTTALAVNIEWAPTHIAGLPIASERRLPRDAPQKPCPLNRNCLWAASHNFRLRTQNCVVPPLLFYSLLL